MFGYIRPMKSELKMREYEQYKGVYCELCRELGRSFGWFSRFVLSYDCTLYAMLSISVSSDAVISADNGRCAANPIKRCRFITCDGDHYKKAAALCVIMTYYKLLDTIEDEGFFKGFCARILKWILSGKAKHAARAYPFIEDNVSRAMKSQAAAESDPSPSLDACAEPTANLLAELFEGLVGENDARALPLRQFGYFLGRWVYIIDAADDLQDDLKQGRFNPLIKKLSLERKTAISDDIRPQIDEECNQILNFTVSMMIPPFNLISDGMFGSILENVIMQGLPQIQKEILFLHVKDKKRKDRLSNE